MLNWLKRLFRPRPDVMSKRRAGPASSLRISFDDKLITVVDEATDAVTMAWPDLVSVAIVTTDAGPFEADLFWILTDRDGRQLPAIPMGATGEAALLQAMQDRLAGFDNMAVIEAMGSTTTAAFQIWPAADLA